jgi:hypothetical protein
MGRSVEWARHLALILTMKHACETLKGILKVKYRLEDLRVDRNILLI